MIILGIETSCDETALALVDIRKNKSGETEVKVIANNVLSQIALHQKYGGVFPAMAKREHSRNLIPLLKKTLTEAAVTDSGFMIQDSRKKELSGAPTTHNLQLTTILEREPELLEQFLQFIPATEKPPIDLIAVTTGPGLEPCLWTGINLAKALALAWNIPAISVNHMEGHIFSALLRQKERNMQHKARNIKGDTRVFHAPYYMLHAPLFPAVALLISGGHTELVLVKDWFSYEIIGETRDDAVGEAFDKAARILGLPYPGGPEISRLAEEARTRPKGSTLPSERLNLSLPRPMLTSKDLDFSFSGLKTAVLYLVKKLPHPLDEKTKREIAREFEDAVTDVLIAKIKKALETYEAKTLIIGGGVIANARLRRAFEDLAGQGSTLKSGERLNLAIPESGLTTDNALMIAVAGYLRYAVGEQPSPSTALEAHGNQRLDSRHVS